jgi:antitoxin ParD1/3/4
MQKNTSVSLGNHFEEFITRQITSGRFGSTSETIRAGLRLLEDHESKLAVLRQALVDGEKSGDAKYSLKDLKKELDSE